MSHSFKKRYSPDILRFGEDERRNIQLTIIRKLMNSSKFKIYN
ncbi:hypothetical protein HMPREF0645_0553 [Hallella bergensis DSM 17361]|uniref:Uncharacterized protein n=1 Tax=Hallella bergensis DSM 17361 TaxID=585502 RepID=D1PUB8_9BACT|nr:hypothetical protein HMPREF0645_0553 [Hallella bergensis DSM 17361]